jgi:hypothetical protein
VDDLENIADLSGDRGEHEIFPKETTLILIVF